MFVIDLKPHNFLFIDIFQILCFWTHKVFLLRQNISFGFLIERQSILLCLSLFLLLKNSSNFLIFLFNLCFNFFYQKISKFFKDFSSNQNFVSDWTFVSSLKISCFNPWSLIEFYEKVSFPLLSCFILFLFQQECN